ncbi:hypothetical protein ABH920_009458 [Catenulispora sp. EB89]|uniref:hypothetical protein n=1 Tax=Catenulispora sp. EB89 TaxID=3156257 RepID=UPI003519A88B
MISLSRFTRGAFGRVAVVGALAFGTVLPVASIASAAAPGGGFAVVADALELPSNNAADGNNGYGSNANVMIQGNVTFDGAGNFRITGLNKTQCFSYSPAVTGELHWKVVPGGTEQTDSLGCNSLASWKKVTKNVSASGSLSGGNGVELWACIGGAGANCGNFHDTVIPGQSISGIKDKEAKLTGESAGMTETANVTYEASVAFLPGSYNLVGHLDLTGTLDDPEIPDAGSATGSGATCAEAGVTAATLNWQTVPDGAVQTQSLPCTGDMTTSADAGGTNARTPVSQTGSLSSGQSVEVWACLTNTDGTQLCTEHSKVTP